MSFISELERLKQAATNEFLEDRALPKLAFYLADHAEAIEELVRAADDARGAMLYRDNFTEVLSRLTEALAKLEKP